MILLALWENRLLIFHSFVSFDNTFRRRAARLHRQLARRYRRTQRPQRPFTSFRHRAPHWPRQRCIVSKAEHTLQGTNLRYLVTNCPGRSSDSFTSTTIAPSARTRSKSSRTGSTPIGSAPIASWPTSGWPFQFLFQSVANTSSSLLSH